MKASLFSQNYVYSTIEFGSYLSHSDNELQITKDNDLSSSNGFNIGIQIKVYKKIKLQIEGGYFKSNAKDIISISAFDTSSMQDISERAELNILAFPIDLAIIPYSNSWLAVGIGPSIVFINRALTVDFKEPVGKFEDRLNSVGLGYNFFANVYFSPFEMYSNFKLNAGIKFRFIDSISLTKDGRDLSNYSLDFNQRIIFFGFSYKFGSSED
jgi:hypothetical protein